MVGPWPHRPFTFRALAKTYGQMWLRCDVCRRYARLKLGGLHDVDSRTKTFGCSQCGGEAYFCVVEPITERERGRGLSPGREREARGPSRGCPAAHSTAAAANLTPRRGNAPEQGRPPVTGRAIRRT